MHFLINLINLIHLMNLLSSELLVSSNYPLLDSIQIVDYNGKYISIVNSNYSLNTPTNKLIVENNSNIVIQSNYTQYVDLWNLDILDNNKNNEYNYFYTGKDVIVYVIDSGITDSQEFEGRLKNGASFNPYEKSTIDCVGHGTHVASIIGSKTYGVAKKVILVPVKVFDCDITTTASIVIQAIYWIIKQPKGIVNLSIAGVFNKLINNAVKDLIDKGFIVIAAAGNNGEDACKYSPSSEKNVVVAGCSTSNNEVCSYSNEGSCVSLFAPGDNILGLSNGKAVYKSGTSMSSPHIVGIAAMIYEKYPGIEQKSMKNILLNMAINNTLNSFKMTTSPLLELRGFKNDSTIKCSSLVKYACSKTPTCTYFKYYGCRAVNFCGFRTKKECLSRKRCKFIGKCKII